MLVPEKEVFNLRRILRQEVAFRTNTQHYRMSCPYITATGEKPVIRPSHKAIFFAQIKENDSIWGLKEQEII